MDPNIIAYFKLNQLIMKQITLTSLLLIFILASACTGNKKEENDHAHHDHQEHHHHEEHTEDGGSVELNNGERWEANPETNEGIDNMLVLVSKEDANVSTDLKALQKDLRSEFNTVLQKCTMKGESHNQLHNYLHPLKEKIDGLDQASNEAHAINDLEQYLNTYKNYFK